MAADAVATSDVSTESVFNKAFVKAIKQKHNLPAVHDRIMQGNCVLLLTVTGPDSTSCV